MYDGGISLVLVVLKLLALRMHEEQMGEKQAEFLSCNYYVDHIFPLLQLSNRGAHVVGAKSNRPPEHVYSLYFELPCYRVKHVRSPDDYDLIFNVLYFLASGGASAYDQP